MSFKRKHAWADLDSDFDDILRLCETSPQPKDGVLVYKALNVVLGELLYRQALQAIAKRANPERTINLGD